MRTITVFTMLFFLVGNVLAPTGASQTAPSLRAESYCGPSGKAFTRTTLYFGLTGKMGGITEAQWQGFLRKQVTPRFPDGLTVWEANGQWRQPDGRIAKERSKVLLLVHEDTGVVRASVAALIAEYKRDFQQESVLWETAPVCAAF